jgi:CRP/FNR family transcriptional regulator, nitrogen oxide reductase regulator
MRIDTTLTRGETMHLNVKLQTNHLPPARCVGHGMMEQRAAAVERFELFSGISRADCARIVSTAQERHFARRQRIFFEGNPIKHVILLVSGSVKITQFGLSGHGVILRINGPGEMVGAIGPSPCLGQHGEHCSTAWTLEKSSVLAWETVQFETLSERFPFLRRNAAHILEKWLQELEERFREISTERVSPRLSSELVRLLGQVGKRKSEGHLEILLSHQELAQLTGTTLFTVSRLLCQWESHGIVSLRRGGVLVKNVPALIDLSQEGNSIT